MSQDDANRTTREPAEDEVAKAREPADVEAHLRGHEPAENEAGKDDPDVEAHVRAFGPPLIEDSKGPEKRR